MGGVTKDDWDVDVVYPTRDLSTKGGGYRGGSDPLISKMDVSKMDVCSNKDENKGRGRGSDVYNDPNIPSRPRGWLEIRSKGVHTTDCYPSDYTLKGDENEMTKDGFEKLYCDTHF